VKGIEQTQITILSVLENGRTEQRVVAFRDERIASLVESIMRKVVTILQDLRQDTNLHHMLERFLERNLVRKNTLQQGPVKGGTETGCRYQEILPNPAWLLSQP
jgi:hypothetical protein